VSFTATVLRERNPKRSTVRGVAAIAARRFVPVPQAKIDWRAVNKITLKSNSYVFYT
jgi:hypothetical protein